MGTDGIVIINIGDDMVLKNKDGYVEKTAKKIEDNGIDVIYKKVDTNLIYDNDVINTLCSSYEPNVILSNSTNIMSKIIMMTEPERKIQFFLDTIEKSINFVQEKNDTANIFCFGINSDVINSQKTYINRQYVNNLINIYNNNLEKLCLKYGITYLNFIGKDRPSNNLKLSEITHDEIANYLTKQILNGKVKPISYQKVISK